MGPVRERVLDLRRRPDDVRDILAHGARRCREVARQTMDEVRAKLGLLSASAK